MTQTISLKHEIMKVLLKEIEKCRNKKKHDLSIFASSQCKKQAKQHKTYYMPQVANSVADVEVRVSLDDSNRRRMMSRAARAMCKRANHQRARAALGYTWHALRRTPLNVKVATAGGTK